MMRPFIAIATIVLLLLGCMEYEMDYEYIIINKIDQPISVEAILEAPLGKNSRRINKSQQVKILNCCGGTGGKKEYPNDIRDEFWYINSLKVSTEDTLFPVNLADKNLWLFSSEVHRGIYTLTIDSAKLSLK